jgi:hypothetical protein
MKTEAPDQAFAKRYNPKIAAATESAFDGLVARRGGNLKDIKEHEYEELRRQARLAGRNDVFADHRDMQWSYDKDTGRFRRKPLGVLIVAILTGAAALGGDFLYDMLKPYIFGG